jgi:hypothetical protein
MALKKKKPKQDNRTKETVNEFNRKNSVLLALAFTWPIAALPFLFSCNFLGDNCFYVEDYGLNFLVFLLLLVPGISLLSLMDTKIKLKTISMSLFSFLTLASMWLFVPLCEHYSFVGGRPMRKKGTIHFTPIKSSTDWILNKSFTKPKHSWLEIAQGEHSSVTAFGNLGLELIKLGCPPDILTNTYRAALDEIDHAQVAFTLDVANGSSPSGPAEELGILGRMSHQTHLYKMALNTFTDGCVFEALSAHKLEDLANEEPDKKIKKEIRRITLEESQHVELSWQILEWSISQIENDKHRALLFKKCNFFLDKLVTSETDKRKQDVLNEVRGRLLKIKAHSLP